MRLIGVPLSFSLPENDRPQRSRHVSRMPPCDAPDQTRRAHLSRELDAPDSGEGNRRRRCPVPVDHLRRKRKPEPAQHSSAAVSPTTTKTPSRLPFKIPSLSPQQDSNPSAKPRERNRARERNIDLERETMVSSWSVRKRVSPEERSTSLPCHRHPTISKLEWEILAVGDVIRAGAHLRPALTQLERLHLASVNLLLLPSTVETLRRQSSSALAESLLEDLLSCADAYGSLRMALLYVQDLRSEAQAAVRRRDESTLCGAARSLRRAQKEISSLVKLLPISSVAGDSGDVTRILWDVTSATTLVSTSVFQGLSDALGAAAAAALPKPASYWQRLLKSTPARSSLMSEESASRASTGLKEMEESLLGLDKATENVYRVLVNARVSLLNALTPS